MTLGVHALIGAAAARHLAYGNPILGLIIGIATHYLSDAIPHWDYKISSYTENDRRNIRRWNIASSETKKDFLRVASDATLGIALTIFLAWPESTATLMSLLLAAIGALLPDFLQGVYFATRIRPLAPLQKFHDFLHTKIRLGPYPFIGIPFQLLIAFAAIFFLRY